MTTRKSPRSIFRTEHTTFFNLRCCDRNRIQLCAEDEILKIWEGFSHSICQISLLDCFHYRNFSPEQGCSEIIEFSYLPTKSYQSDFSLSCLLLVSRNQNSLHQRVAIEIQDITILFRPFSSNWIKSNNKDFLSCAIMFHVGLDDIHLQLRKLT